MPYDWSKATPFADTEHDNLLDAVDYDHFLGTDADARGRNSSKSPTTNWTVTATEVLP